MRSTASELPDESLRERWSADLEDLKDGLRSSDQWVRSFVHERPLAALTAAIATGFLAGRIMSRI